jgi:hypothetical protein
LSCCRKNLWHQQRWTDSKKQMAWMNPLRLLARRRRAIVNRRKKSKTVARKTSVVMVLCLREEQC